MTIKPILFSLFLFIPLYCGYSQEATGYDGLKKRIAEKRLEFSAAYASSGAAKREDVVRQARDYLTAVIHDSIFPYWYGTPWAFYGTTAIPGQGTIACGYFVTAVLSDAGFQIPRVKWAQMASEPVIVKIASDIQRFSRQPMSKVEEYLRKHGDGLYIVGLDRHIGFVFKSGDDLRFIHSNYYQPAIGVMSEPIVGDNPLDNSGYRVIGKLLSGEMVRNWISAFAYR